MAGVGSVDDEQLRVLLVLVGVLLGLVVLDGEDGGSFPVSNLLISSNKIIGGIIQIIIVIILRSNGLNQAREANTM